MTAIRHFLGMRLPQISERQNTLRRCRDHRVSKVLTNLALTLLNFTHLQIDQKMATEHEQEVHPRGIRMANRHLKRCLTSLSFAISIKFPLTQQFYLWKFIVQKYLHKDTKI